MCIASNVQAAQVQLSWVAPATNANGSTLQDLSGYKVYVGQASRTYGTAAGTSNQTNYMLSGLTAGQRYYTAVTAYDTSGNESAYSTEINFVAPSDTPPPSSAPVASFTASPTSGTAPLAVTFAETSTGSITSWSWDFGDGGTSATRQPTHTYTSPGTYNVRLTVAGSGGSNSANRADYITVSQPGSSSSGLVAAYSFNEGTGSTLSDSSGRGNHGTIASATWTNSGRYGKALVFNGTSAWVTIPDSASLDLSNGMTLAAWIYPTAFSGGTPAGWRQVLLKEQSNQLVYSLIANTDTNRPAAYAYTSRDLGVNGTSQVPLNQWTHLAATYDRSALRLYVNGGLVNSSPVTGAIQTSSGPLRIGGNSVWEEFFAGRIDEVRVYNRALSATEIQADQNRAIGSTASGGLVAHSLPSPKKLGHFLATRSQAASSAGLMANATRSSGTAELSSNSHSSQRATSADLTLTELTSAQLNIGEATVDQQWQHIAFTQALVEPVVVAKTLSYRDATPALVRLSPPDQTGFAMRLQPLDPAQGAHAAETIGYLAMEKGHYILAGGAQVESGAVEVDAAQPVITLSFSQPFRVPPIVMSAVSGPSETGAVLSNPFAISTSGFQVRLQQSAAMASDPDPVTFSYIAWEPSAGTIDGLTFEVNTMVSVSENQVQTIQFSEAFAEAPVLLAEIQSATGTRPAVVRWDQKDATGTAVRLDGPPLVAAPAGPRRAVVGYISLR